MDDNSPDEEGTEAIRKLIEANWKHPGFVIPTGEWERLRKAAHAVRLLRVDPAALLEVVVDALGGHKPRHRGAPADETRRRDYWTVWPRLELFQHLSELAAATVGSDPVERRRQLIDAGNEIVRAQLAKLDLTPEFIKIAHVHAPVDSGSADIEAHVDWFIKAHATPRRNAKKGHRAFALDRLNECHEREVLSPLVLNEWKEAAEEYEKLLDNFRTPPPPTPGAEVAAIRLAVKRLRGRIGAISGTSTPLARPDAPSRGQARRRCVPPGGEKDGSPRSSRAHVQQRPVQGHGLEVPTDGPPPAGTRRRAAISEAGPKSFIRPARRPKMDRRAEANQHERPRHGPGKVKEPP